MNNSESVQVIEGNLRSLRPFSISFGALGVFLPGTLVAASVMTDKMIAMNRTNHTVADHTFVPSKQYVYGTWAPHLTLATELTNLELVKAFDIAGLDWMPLSSWIVRISLVHHFPYTEELVVPLV